MVDKNKECLVLSVLTLHIPNTSSAFCTPMENIAFIITVSTRQRTATGCVTAASEINITGQRMRENCSFRTAKKWSNKDLGLIRKITDVLDSVRVKIHPHNVHIPTESREPILTCARPPLATQMSDLQLTLRSPVHFSSYEISVVNRCDIPLNFPNESHIATAIKTESPTLISSTYERVV